MKYTQVAADAFQKLQLNAGVILNSFDPTNPPTKNALLQSILMATSGGTSFASNPEYVDFGDDIDNVPPNTKQLKRLQSVNPVLSGTARTVDTATGKLFMAAADVSGDKITPRTNLLDSDFEDDVWWVGDYSNINDDSSGSAGFIAIHMTNVLSTGGFQLKSNDDGKGDFSFELTAHYDLDNIDTLPFEVYIKAGATGATGATA